MGQEYGEQLAQLAPGDTLLMYENRVGLVAVGRVQEAWHQASHTTPQYYTTVEIPNLTGGAYEYRIAVDWFLDLSQSPLRYQEVKTRLGYTPRGAVRRIVQERETVANLLVELRTAYSPLPEEVPRPASYREGTRRQVVVNAYERSPEARRRCVQHYGTNCHFCGFSFGAVYGNEARGFIHVHHVRPLSQVGEAYEVDPVADLLPVCPNCHAFIHLGGGCRSIEKVRQVLKRASQLSQSPQKPAQT